MIRQLEAERREALKWARTRCFGDDYLLKLVNEALDDSFPAVEMTPIVETIVKSFRELLRLFWEKAQEHHRVETLIDWCSDAPTTFARYYNVLAPNHVLPRMPERK